MPVPVLSDTSLHNSVHFLIHIILSLGRYNTEIDALNHPSFWTCLQSVDLIGNNTDTESLVHYVNVLTKKYIVSQLVFYPNSMKKSETFIVMAHGIFNNVILHDSIPINELPPYTMNRLRVEKSNQNDMFWRKIKESQLTSVMSAMSNMENFPTVEQVMNADQDRPLNWNPLDHFQRSANQLEESFLEQKSALQHIISKIDQFRNTTGIIANNYTKNQIIYGAPGTGKSFICQLLVLYCLTQGLNNISTSLLGIQAISLGGKHLHKLFCLPTDNRIQLSPFQAAEYAIPRIMRKTEQYHAILTADSLFVDELGQKSAQQISTIDIICCKLRNSQIRFGGLIIFGSMDNAQIQPINQLPFLTTTLVMTCFQAFELKHSVRAHGDPDFQRLQNLARMCQFELRQSYELKSDFFSLAARILTFVPNWNDTCITLNMMRVFSQIRPAQAAINKYREKIKQLLEMNQYHMSFCIQEIYKGQEAPMMSLVMHRKVVQKL